MILNYCIAGKFGGQKIWRIVLEAEKIKIWRNFNLANSCRRTFAHTQTRTCLCVFGDVIQARVNRAAPDSYVRVQVS